jgi:hypothetical protein
LDERSGQGTKEEIDTLGKQLIDSYLEIGSIQSSPDPTDKTQVQLVTHQTMEAIKKFLMIRSELYRKEMSIFMEFYGRTKKGEDKARMHMTGNNLLLFIMDNAMLLILFTLVDSLIKSSPELDSLRNQMNVYAEIMKKFKTLVDDKTTGKPVEAWFNIIWDRQVKRGVVR